MKVVGVAKSGMEATQGRDVTGQRLLQSRRPLRLVVVLKEVQSNDQNLWMALGEVA